MLPLMFSSVAAAQAEPYNVLVFTKNATVGASEGAAALQAAVDPSVIEEGHQSQESEGRRLAAEPSHPALDFQAAGYGTTLVGKWHLGFLPDFSPLKSGYDHFFGIWGGSSDYFNHGSKSESPLYEQEVPVDRVGYMTNLLGDRAVQTRRRICPRETAVLPEPAFHRAALALGGTARRGGVEADRRSHPPLRRRQPQRPTARWCKAWTRISAASCKRSMSPG